MKQRWCFGEHGRGPDHHIRSLVACGKVAQGMFRSCQVHETLAHTNHTNSPCFDFDTHFTLSKGQRFRSRPGATNEGAFCLSWVHGVRVAIVDGKRCPVEVDVHSQEYGFQRSGDTATKLRMKRFGRRIDDISKLWSSSRAPSLVQETARAKAARAAERLEREDVNDQVRRRKAEKRREQKLRKVAAYAEAESTSETSTRLADEPCQTTVDEVVKGHYTWVKACFV